MITAEMARKIVVASAIHIDEIIAIIEKKITDAAYRSERQYKCFIDGFYFSVLTNDVSTSMTMTNDQRLIAEKFWDLGFVVELGTYGPAFQKESGSPLFTNVCLIISW